MELCSLVNKNLLNNTEYVLYFRFFKVATCYFDDPLGVLSLSLRYTWNGFPTILKEFPGLLSRLLAGCFSF